MQTLITDTPHSLFSPKNRTTWSRSTHGFSLIELLVAIGLISVLIGILLPSLGRAQDAARRVRCAAQLKNLGVAWAIYTDRYPEAFPPAVSMPSFPIVPDEMTIMKALSDEVRAPDAYACPSDDRRNFQELGISYEYLPGLAIALDPNSARTLKQVARQQAHLMPILSDAEAYHPRTGDSEFRQTLYHDGHIEDLSGQILSFVP